MTYLCSYFGDLKIFIVESDCVDYFTRTNSSVGNLNSDR